MTYDPEYRRRYHLKNRAKSLAYNHRRYEENKAVVDRIKCESGCVQCGEKDPVCLQFHHRDPEQRVAQVAALCGFSAHRLLDEIAKCDVLCANCHRKTHYKECRLPIALRKRRLKQGTLDFQDPPP